MSGGGNFDEVALVLGLRLQFAHVAGVEGEPSLVGLLAGEGIEGAETVTKAVF